MIYLWILIALFILDGLTTHLLMDAGAKEVGVIARFFLDKSPDVRELAIFTGIKIVVFGILFFVTEGADNLHQGLVIGAGLVFLFNVVQIFRSRQ